MGDPGLEVAANLRRANEGSGHGQDEAEHEGDQDQDLGHPDPDLQLVRTAILAGEADQSVEAPRDQRHRQDRERCEDPDDPPPDELTDGQPGDHDHAGTSAGSLTSSRKRASRDPRPGSTAWTRPPAATTVATSSGIRAAARGRITSQSPSIETGPKAATAARPSSSSSVTRSRTPSAATTSSMGPAAMTRP